MLQEEEVETMSNTFLLFTIGQKLYAINISYVIEVIEMQNIMSMPEMPHYIRGVLNLRGNVISIIDMIKRIGLQPSCDDSRECIIIININTKKYGLIVENVKDVIEIANENIEVPSALDIDNQSITCGTAKLSDDLCIMLNTNNIV